MPIFIVSSWFDRSRSRLECSSRRRGRSFAVHRWPLSTPHDIRTPGDWKAGPNSAVLGADYPTEYSRSRSHGTAEEHGKLRCAHIAFTLAWNNE